MKKIAYSLILLSGFMLTSCEEDEPTNTEHAHATINLTHKVDDHTLEFDTLKYINAAGHKYEVQTLKYFISNIDLHKAGGGKVSIPGPFYIDAEDASTLTLDQHVDVTSGTYEKITIDFGLDTLTNISNSLSSTEAIAMAWPDMMGGGYHYMKLEGTYDSLQMNNIKNFAVHTGASMGTDYHIDIELPNSNFTVGENDININIEMDVNEWFKNPNDYNFADFPQMIMMEMQAQMQLKANGASIFTTTIN